MKIKLFFPMLFAVSIALSGCKGMKSLERTPAKKRQQSTRSSKGGDALSTDDSLFDSVFRKSRKEADDATLPGAELTAEERALYNQNRAIRASDDPVVRALRDKHKESKKERSDWVRAMEF